MLDRLQPTEKKILLDYILDKYIINPDGSLKEPDIEYEDILNGEHNVVDYFMKFWID